VATKPEENAMQVLLTQVLLTLALLLAGIVSATAESAAPNLKGTWIGTFKSLVYGNNPHHPGAESLADPPRVREVKFTFEVEGQDGRLLWGKSWSSPDRKEPFAFAMSEDRKTIVGTDTDGQFLLKLLSANRMELCYTHTYLSPTQSMVATCGNIDRMK
jgi:hypothetical protein